MALQIYANPNLAAQLQMQGGLAFANGISQAGAAVGEGLGQYLAKRKAEADQLEQLRTAWEAYQGSQGEAPTGPGPATPAMGSFGRSEGPNDGTGEGSATPQEQADEYHAKASKLTTAMRTVAEHGYGVPKTQVNQMGLNQLKGLIQGETLKSAAQERAMKAAEMEAMARWRDSEAAHMDTLNRQAMSQYANEQKAPAYYAELSRYIPADQSISGPFDPNNDLQYLLPPGQSGPGPSQQIRAIAASGYVPPPALIKETGVAERAAMKDATTRERTNVLKAGQDITKQYHDARIKLSENSQKLRGDALAQREVERAQNYEIAKQRLGLLAASASDRAERTQILKQRADITAEEFRTKLTPLESKLYSTMAEQILFGTHKDPDNYDQEAEIQKLEGLFANKIRRRDEAFKAGKAKPAPASAAPSATTAAPPAPAPVTPPATKRKVFNPATGKLE